MRRKICVVIGSRANYGRIKSVCKAINEHPDLELQLIAGASALLYRFGQVIDIIRRDGFDVHATVYSIVEGENLTTMAKSTGLAIIELATLFENLRPDVVLTVADRFETLATAVASSYMNVPLAHTQGGEITGSIDENVRHAITKLAHIHFPATRLSAERLIRMGEDPETVYLTGCPSLDIILETDLSAVGRLGNYGGVGLPIDIGRPYLVVLQHPVTTEYGDGLSQVRETLQAIKEMNMQTVWLWPNVDAGSDDISKGMRMFREHNRDVPVHFYRNFTVEDYLILIKNCSCMIGNSSSAIREGAFLGVPAVNIGTRQQGRERGENVIDVDYRSSMIVSAVRKQLAHGPYPSNHMYGDGKAGQKIADVLSKAKFNIQKKFYMNS
jgi:UDP-hydrolysing UDP-N-acetyl-D-glucosamine 2-epimerase